MLINPFRSELEILRSRCCETESLSSRRVVPFGRAIVGAFLRYTAFLPHLRLGRRMPRYRNRLPQLSENIFLTDGGMETDLIFHEGFQLPCFAALVLLENERGIEGLRNYYR